ncbi:MAG: hypothetical protein WCI73_07865, partial [Phycisphaerae bacterium]
ALNAYHARITIFRGVCMSGPNLNYLPLLQQVCNLPTAPYAEQHVIAFLLAWAQADHRRQHLRITRDPAGNVYLHYRHGHPRNAAGKPQAPLIIEAHMDHPGFLLTEITTDGRLHARFRGGVKPSHFTDAIVGFWQPDLPTAVPTHPIEPCLTPRGHWLPARVLDAVNVKHEQGDYIAVTLEWISPPATLPAPVGTLGMWHLPDAAVLDGNGKGQNELFCARVCDDLAGVAAGLCLLDELIQQKAEARVTLFCSRAEEVGFAGVIAAARAGWISKRSPVIGLETSKASLPGQSGAAQGEGPVVRVADKSGVFSAGLTHFLCQAAAGIADEDPHFRWQRKLMDGGTCNTSAFIAYGYDSASLTLPLGNYHNMANVEDVEAHHSGGCDFLASQPPAKRSGSTPPPTPNVPFAGPGIASETIHLGDFAQLVRILVAVVRKYPTYQPRFGIMRERLEKLHATEQQAILYATSDSSPAAAKKS